MKTTRIIRSRHPLLQLVLGAVGLLTLLAFLILWGIVGRIGAPMVHQQGAERWQGEGALRYEQVSVFRSVADGLNAQTIEAADTVIDLKLNDAGIADASYLIAYGAEQNARAVSQNGRCDAALTWVGGDFFRLHGFAFLSGTGFQPEDVMQDRVVLDELAAWQLFSSNNCVGLSLTIDGNTYYVAGVVEQETDNATAECYGEKPRIYASYTGWQWQAGEDASLPVTFCEAVLPEPVDDFAAATFAAAIGVEEKELCNNTERDTFTALWDNLQGLHMQGILSNAVVYPYWESAARLAANRQSLLLVPMLLCLIVPLGWGVYGVICLWRLVKAGGRGVAKLADNVIERRRTNRYLKAMALRRQMKERKEYDESFQSVEETALPVAGSSYVGSDSDGLQ